MNLTTPSKNVARRSGRASRPTQRFSSPGYVVERPQHRSAAPVDATTYSVGFLKRQDARQQPWFRDLDFVKVAEADIKKIFWTSFMEEKFSEYIPIPLALRRDPQSIRTFYNKGLQQKRDLVRALSKFEDGQYYQQLYAVTATAAKTPATASFPCTGVNLASIERSYLLSSERKETLMFGFKQVVREGLHNKYRLLPRTSSIGTTSGSETPRASSPPAWGHRPGRIGWYTPRRLFSRTIVSQ